MLHLTLSHHARTAPLHCVMKWLELAHGTARLCTFKVTPASGRTVVKLRDLANRSQLKARRQEQAPELTRLG